MDLENFVNISNQVFESENEDSINEYADFSGYQINNARKSMNLNKKWSDFDSLLSLLGRKANIVIQNIYKFCCYIDMRFGKAADSYNYISQTSYTKIPGFTIRKMQETIDKCISLGIIYPISENYTFTSESTKSQSFRSRARYFVVDKESIKEIKKDYKDRYNNKDIEEDNDKENNNITIYSSTRIRDKKYQITSKTAIIADRDEIIAGLYANYPEKAYFDNLISVLNKNLERDNERIAYNFNLKYKGNKCVKIGIRATNPTVSFKSLEKHNGDLGKYHGMTREEYLEDCFGEYEEFDVKSSVPRVMYFMNTGIWKENSFDFYNEIWKKACGNDFSCKRERDCMKSWFMKIAFNRSYKDMIKNAKRSFEPDFIAKNNKVIEALYNATWEILGSNIKSEIFYHESNIYLLVREYFASHKIDCVQVYDGFYFKNGTMPDDMEEIVKNAAEKYLQLIKKEEKTMEDKITLDQFAKFVLESNKVFEKARYENDTKIYEDDNGNRGKGNALVMAGNNTEITASEAAEFGIPFLFYSDDIIS